MIAEERKYLLLLLFMITPRNSIVKNQDWRVRALIELECLQTIYDWLLIFVFVAGHTIAFEKGFDGTSGQIGKFAFAFYNGLFSYDGW